MSASSWAHRHEKWYQSSHLTLGRKARKEIFSKCWTNIISCFLVSGGSLQGRLSEGAEGQGEAEGEVSGAGEEVQKGPQWATWPQTSGTNINHTAFICLYSAMFTTVDIEWRHKDLTAVSLVFFQVVKTRPPQPAPECTCTNRDWEDRPVNQNHMQLHRR